MKPHNRTVFGIEKHRVFILYVIFFCIRHLLCYHINIKHNKKIESWCRMNKFYNTQQIISSNIKDFLLKVDSNIRKSQLNIIPFIIIGMILAESSTSSDIAKNLKDDFSLVQHDSVVRRIKRLFTNKYFNPYKFIYI